MNNFFESPAVKKRPRVNSAKKPTGLTKNQQFALKERERVYDQRSKELEEKMNKATKESVMRTLAKQKNDLDTEFHDVLTHLKTPQKPA